jgi:8-oxo-dGTP pyrophosphatase MutT (NUDIX family)
VARAEYPPTHSMRADSTGPADQVSLVEVRCAAAVVRGDQVLLIERPELHDWVLPGGRPRDRENMGSCARREVREETGVDVNTTGCAFVLEVNDPIEHRRVVELIFRAECVDPAAELVGEPGRNPQWVTTARLPYLQLRPQIGGYLPDLITGRGGMGRYIGNMWRPSRSGP